MIKFGFLYSILQICTFLPIIKAIISAVAAVNQDTTFICAYNIIGKIKHYNLINKNKVKNVYSKYPCHLLIFIYFCL